jgi:hypothetical protein
MTSFLPQDGVFAKRDIKKGELILYYSGVIFNPQKDPIFFNNQTEEEKYETFLFDKLTS